MRARLPAVAVAALLAALGASAPAMAAQRTVASGSVTATLSWSGTFHSPGPISLTITRAGTPTTFSGLEDDPTGGGVPHAIVGQSGWSVLPGRPLRVRDLDGDGDPEVIVSLFSGGAHCCELAVVASFDPAGGAYRLATHFFGDAGWLLRDEGDGVPSFVSWDSRWAYWGGVYTGSPEPIQIWGFAHGAFTDATRRFPAALRKDRARQWAYWGKSRRQGGSYRGALAAYVADAYSLGAPGPAWTRVRGAYRAPGRARFFTALRNQLERLDYLAPPSSPPSTGGTTGGY